MSYADQLYLMQLEFQKQMKAAMKAVTQGFQAVRDEERRLEEERERREEQEAAATPEGKTRAMWDVDSRKYGYYEDEE
jgi:hypothetical protein